MHSLNLFGIPLEEQLGKETFKDIAGSNAETQKVLKDLIEISEEIGGNNF